MHTHHTLDPEYATAMQQLRVLLTHHISLLSPRTQQVLLLIYLYDYTQVEAANELRISKSRVNQLHLAGLSRLRYVPGLGSYAVKEVHT